MWKETTFEIECYCMLRLFKQGTERSEEVMNNIPVNPVTTDPRHYNKLRIEPWDFIQQNKLDFFEGNVVKYICRWKNKGGVDDLRKAITYIEKIIEGENS